MSPNLLSNRKLQGTLMAAGLFLSMVFRGADAATDLADVPLANATTAIILPNIAFVFDDSGSMDEENMPDDNGTNKGSYCYKWHKYNTLAYNPAQTYKPPIKADGTRYPNSVFTAALKDGYFSVAQMQFDGITNNETINLTKLDSLGGSMYYATHKTNPDSKTCASNANYNIVTTASGIAAPGVAAGSSEALTNYANWYSYYRKRAFLMKAGVGEAFAALEPDKFRIGLFFINSVQSGAGYTNNDLAINTFSGAHRDTWFSRLYGARKDGSTPLRGALSRMGQMYAGKISGWDPVQYSCQRNYTILSTDGFWNTYAEKFSYGPKQMDGSTNVGDRDGAVGVTKPSLDSAKASNTLADVAYYYYHTDLRPGSCASPDVCTNNVAPVGSNSDTDDVASHQHMTTFTVGLGVNGSLAYKDGYKTSTSGDYYDIVQGTKSWPNPVDGKTDTSDRIDDLWHAAVNGRGTYFSAKDPNTLTNGLTASLNAIESVNGSGAAAATSNLQPTTGDNAIYIATYRTVDWDGEVKAYSANLSTGAISTDATWVASPLLAKKIATAGNSDTRIIYTSDGTTRTLFKEGTGGLTETQLAYFDNTKLSQYADWSADQKSAATRGLLVNYLRGHDRYEDQARDSGYGTYQRLYRNRSTILGDIVHSQPVYVKAPPHDYSDDGYGAFKTANTDRPPTLYVASNDGMLHAFDAATGEERWAYVPSIIMPEMWRLADSAYSSNHRFFLDGPIIVTDAKIGGTWKTVLIGALGKGGRGYYALDITDPEDPRPMWSFSAANNHNVGYTYGAPVVTKMADGTWVALLTSGHNNIPEGGKYSEADGKGTLFVVNLATGGLYRSTITTGVGSVDSPSGLSRINIRAANYESNNEAEAVYGGDLYGNMWRFDINTGAVTKLASLGSAKPITAGPEVGEIEGKTVVYFGTGRYLGEDDLPDARTQSIFGILDDGTTTVTGVSQLVQQTVSGDDKTRNISTNEVDWSSKFGWYVNLPDSGERVAIEPQLYFGTLVVPSIVPTASECQPGGYSWLYQLDYRTGGNVVSTKPAATYKPSPIVGITVTKLPGGTPVIYGIPADGRMPTATPMNLSDNGAGGKGARRVLWRPLMD